MEFFKSGTRIDFVAKMPLCLVISAVLVVASWALMLTKGFNFGIDFAGGTLVEVQLGEASGDADEGRVRGALGELGFNDGSIVRVGAPEERTFRINLPASQEEDRDLSLKIVSGLSEKLGAPVEVRSVESIGPRVGGELRRTALQAILLSWIGILLYIWFRFEWQYAPGAVVALVHDISITAGLFSLFGWEFDLQVLAALLVIIGYSINDTIVIYDRIRETVSVRGTSELESVVNEATNGTLSRTILTSGLTQLAVVAILVLGGPVLRGFSLALFIGIIVGTYSSIFIASALLIRLSRRYGHPAPAKTGAKARASS
ncbi:MAG: protein translocase subunit SecF [Deltaproteobacteria bacterium]|nr:protein translocase subunit SecF [Deltaproteobacteria bacterium]